MPPGGEARCATARSKEAGNRHAGAIQHLGMGRCFQTTKREKAEIARLEIKLERDERPLIQRSEDRRLFVEERIAPFMRMGVVDRHGRRQRAFRHFKLGLNLFPAIAGAGNGHLGKVHRLDEMRIVEKQIDLATRLVDGTAADPAMVAILIDEALAHDIDKHAIGMGLRHRPGTGREELLHMDRLAPGTKTEHDAHAVVLVAYRCRDFEGFRAIFAPHLFIHHKAAGRKHHAFACADEAVLVVDPHHQTDNPTLILDQPHGPGINHDLYALCACRCFKRVDKRTSAAPAHMLDGMTARSRLCDVAKGGCRLTTRPDQC